MNRKRELRQFNVGDQVYMFPEQNYKSHAFGESKVRGPYIVTERVGHKAYRLRSLKYPEHKHPKSTVSIDRLVPYFEREPASTVDQQILDQLDASGFSNLYQNATVESFAIPQYSTLLSGGNDKDLSRQPTTERNLDIHPVSENRNSQRNTERPRSTKLDIRHSTGLDIRSTVLDIV